MTETAAAHSVAEDTASVAARARIAAVVRQELADEAAAGFPLLRRYPNVTTAGIPDHYLSMSESERSILLDMLVYYGVVRRNAIGYICHQEKNAHPVLGPFIRRQPKYPPGDWYGERPKRSAIRKIAKQKLLDAGYFQLQSPPGHSSTYLEFNNSNVTSQGRLVVFLNPPFLGQLDFGFRNWLHGDLLKHFEPQSPREFSPIVNRLAYDHLWHGLGQNNNGCWDVITEGNLTHSMTLMVEVLQRLEALATRINGLAA